MRIHLRLFDPASGDVDNVLLTAEPETPMPDVAGALGALCRDDLYLRGRPLRDRSGTVGSDLHNGDELAIGQPAPAMRVSMHEVAVIGGPLSGRRFPVSTNPVDIGRSPDCTVVLDEPSVSRQQCRLTFEPGGCRVEDLGSKNQTVVNGSPPTPDAPIRSDDIIDIGDTLLSVRPPVPADADIRPDGASRSTFNRPARISPAASPAKVSLPSKPSPPEPVPFPWAQIAIPIALAVVATALFRRPEAMLFAIMGPVLAISNVRTTRRRIARKAAQDDATYDAQLSAARLAIATAAAKEIALLRSQLPDAATVAGIATGPNRRLWERRLGDPDAHWLRVGLAHLTASVTVSAPASGTIAGAAPEVPTLEHAPVSVDLAEVGVFGVAGPRPQVMAQMRWLIGQQAALRSPNDLQMVLVTHDGTADEWDWVRFLPHFGTDDDHAPMVMVGNDDDTREDRVKNLLRVLEMRLEMARERSAEVFSPSIVVVWDGIRALRAVAGTPRILREGPKVGIYSIGIDSDGTRLAEEGKAEVILSPNDPSRGILRAHGKDPVPDVLVDLVDEDWADQVARSLAALRDAGGSEDQAIPSSVRYVDLARLDLDRVDDVVGRWALGGRSTEALVGVGLDGPLSLDLRRDGPHALVAGTTGAGKSEFLQTLVVSLAVANRPTALNFVLIDYKGGSAFADCGRLPHTVGLVSNLDGHLTERALTSLDAELERRERLLKELGAADIETAWQNDPDGAEAGGLARLVIVIDEFAELKQELPQFVNGLIRIARVGRSLGVHLILATQRPTGVVSPEMKANTGLRVALRMETKEDSSEVLDTAQAALISRSTPGRGYVRTGGGTALTAFQTARVAGRRKGLAEALPPPRARLVPWVRLGYPPPREPRHPGDEAGTTDLAALVGVIVAATSHLKIRHPRSPWLPPLAPVYTLPPLGKSAPGRRSKGATVVFGLEDLPAVQDQRPARVDVEHDGHLIIAGSARSGRSTALRTIAGSLARTLSPADLHLYAIDCGNGALLPVAALPHCGGVVMRSEVDRAERLVKRLTEELTVRQELLARHGFGDIGEQRRSARPDERLPYVTVLIDRWEGFTAQFSTESGSETPSAVLRLLREGLGAGIRFVITGDRSVLIDRIAAQVDDKLVLRLADSEGYRLANLNPKNVAEDMPPGRALRAESGSEIQIALLSADPSGQGQARALKEIAKAAKQTWPSAGLSNRPFRVDVLPASITYDAARRLQGRRRPPSALWAMVAVGGDELGPLGVDLARDGPGFVVAGTPKSGRSTALVCMSRSLLASGAAVVAFCPKLSPLESLAGVTAVFSGMVDNADLAELLPEDDRPVAVLVDDAEALARTGVDDEIRNFVRSRPAGRAALIVAGQIEDLKSELRGMVPEARKSRLGLLLSPPSTLDGDVVGVRLTRNLVGKQPPGRGLLARGGEVTIVQVPL